MKFMVTRFYAQDVAGSIARDLASAPLHVGEEVEIPKAGTTLAEGLTEAMRKSSRKAAPAGANSKGKLNPIGALFGAPRFKVAAKIKGYTNEDGSVAKKIATVALPFVGADGKPAGATLTASIYVQTKVVTDASGKYEQDETYVSLPTASRQPGIVPNDDMPGMGTMMDEWKYSIVEAYSKWVADKGAAVAAASIMSTSRLVTRRPVTV